MFNEEEQQFMALATKFRDEINSIDKQIDELENRRHVLLHLLYGDENVIVEESVDPVMEQIESEVSDLASANTDAQESRDLIDRDLTEFIATNPGCSRQDLQDFFEGTRVTYDDISKSLKRCRDRELITSKGHSRASKWYPIKKKR